MGRAAGVTRREGGCNAARSAAEWRYPGSRVGPGSGDAGQASPSAAADPGRRFDDLFNLVHDPATLFPAFDRVAGNQRTNTPGVDGVTADYFRDVVGVPGFLDYLRAALKDGSFRPLPVRQRRAGTSAAGRLTGTG
jgi:hypothetical protein